MAAAPFPHTDLCPRGCSLGSRCSRQTQKQPWAQPSSFGHRHYQDIFLNCFLNHLDKSEDDSRNVVIKESRQGSRRQGRRRRKEEKEELLTCASPAPESSPRHPLTHKLHITQKCLNPNNPEPIPELLQGRETGKIHAVIPDLPQGCQNGDPHEAPDVETRPHIPVDARPQKGIPCKMK